MQKFAPGETTALRFDILEEFKKVAGFPLSCMAQAECQRIASNFNRWRHFTTHRVPEELVIKAASINVCKINNGDRYSHAYVGGLKTLASSQSL
jgi:hypothetical protein